MIVIIKVSTNMIGMIMTKDRDGKGLEDVPRNPCFFLLKKFKISFLRNVLKIF